YSNGRSSLKKTFTEKPEIKISPLRTSYLSASVEMPKHQENKSFLLDHKLQFHGLVFMSQSQAVGALRTRTSFEKPGFCLKAQGFRALQFSEDIIDLQLDPSAKFSQVQYGRGSHRVGEEVDLLSGPFLDGGHHNEGRATVIRTREVDIHLHSIVPILKGRVFLSGRTFDGFFVQEPLVLVAFAGRE